VLVVVGSADGGIATVVVVCFCCCSVVSPNVAAGLVL